MAWDQAETVSASMTMAPSRLMLRLEKHSKRSSARSVPPSTKTDSHGLCVSCGKLFLFLTMDHFPAKMLRRCMATLRKWYQDVRKCYGNGAKMYENATKFYEDATKMIRRRSEVPRRYTHISVSVKSLRRPASIIVCRLWSSVIVRRRPPSSIVRQ